MRYTSMMCLYMPELSMHQSACPSSIYITYVMYAYTYINQTRVFR